MTQALRSKNPVPLRGLSSAAEIIGEARNGRMFVLVDDEDHENSGDLVIPAQMATPEAINFMATHGRGLICLALPQGRAEELGLGLMPQNNRMPHRSAFTVSIEAREGVTTGISAADRARTISVAIDAGRGAEDLVSPGHVFPLIARPGGVLVRAGHTEAAVDVARLAGLNASGVICQILNDDGTTARLDELTLFAERHTLKIGTIRDLIAYRRRFDRDVVKLTETRFVSRFGGEWSMMSFRNKAVGSETVVLVKGRIAPGRPTLVRMHRIDPFGDALGEAGERSGLLQVAMSAIDAAGTGVVVLLDQPSLGLGEALAARLTRPKKDERADAAELRDYGVGAQILAELGVHDMILLTNSEQRPVALAGYDLSIVEERALAAGTPEPAGAS